MIRINQFVATELKTIISEARGTIQETVFGKYTICSDHVVSLLPLFAESTVEL